MSQEYTPPQAAIKSRVVECIVSDREKWRLRSISARSWNWCNSCTTKIKNMSESHIFNLGAQTIWSSNLPFCSFVNQNLVGSSLSLGQYQCYCRREEWKGAWDVVQETQKHTLLSSTDHYILMMQFMYRHNAGLLTNPVSYSQYYFTLNYFTLFISVKLNRAAHRLQVTVSLFDEATPTFATGTG